MNELSYIILATTILSLFSLLGVFTISFHEKGLKKFLLGLVGLSTGTLLGGAFLHLLPEASESLEAETIYSLMLISFVVFFFLEKYLHWHHCHDGECDKHSIGYMNLIGDSIHNFIDGMIIAVAFITDIRLGVVTSFALAFHEIPQELGDYGVLIYSGMEKTRALFFNFLVAVTSVAGGLVGYFFAVSAEGFVSYLLPVAAGGFLYIAAADLMPSIRDEEDTKKSLAAMGLFVAGLLLMYLAGFLE